jgi:tetratricopeptide (TPR) repeat protein
VLTKVLYCSLQAAQVLATQLVRRPTGACTRRSVWRRRRVKSDLLPEGHSHGSVDQTIQAAVKEFDAGNYRGALALLLPLLREKLSPQQELDVVDWLSGCYRFLYDNKSSLPHIQRAVVLTKELYGACSKELALALKGLCMVHSGLKAFPKARKAIGEALAIMEELGLQHDAEYSSMLRSLGLLDSEQGRDKEALVIYDKAKAVLAQHKEGNGYGALLADTAFCHKNLQQWSEAIACSKEGVEHSYNLYGNSHSQYATTLYNLAYLFADLKQYEEAIPRIEEALAIYQREFSDQHDQTVRTAKELARVRQLAAQSDRGAIDVGHNFRMCSCCGAVSEAINTCPCVRAWYCNADCQLQHWPTHKPHCTICFQCSSVLTKVLHCSRCEQAKYCNAACQTAHWSAHKKDCVVVSK